MQHGAYVFAVIVAAARPRSRRVVRGLPGMGAVHLTEVPSIGRAGAKSKMFVVAADAPMSQYGEAAIQRGLSDLEWVSRAAVAHEKVIESYLDATAVLPMKLFTIFTTEDRALEYVERERKRLTATARRVAHHHEWGIRVVLDTGRAPTASGTRGAGAAALSGVAYLRYKTTQLRAAADRSARARKTMSAVYDRVASRARLSVRRTAAEEPGGGRALLLDAAFLVPRSRTGKFRAVVAREARALAEEGYGLTLTGPWPPYSFVQQ